jgi:hypothetical protein
VLARALWFGGFPARAFDATAPTARADAKPFGKRADESCSTDAKCSCGGLVHVPIFSQARLLRITCYASSDA